MTATRTALEQLLAAELTPIAPIEPGALVVYGAGNCGQKVARRARERGFEVRAFLDANAAAGQSVGEVPCFTPDSAEAGELADAGAQVVIGIFNFAVDLLPVAETLQRLGFRRVLSYYEAHELFEVPDDFWLTRREFYRARSREILAGFETLADETSRRVYSDAIRLRLTFDLSLLREPDLENQYLPADLPAPAEPMRLIDGGAFTGDTVEFFMSRRFELEALAAFEPDPANYLLLATTVSRFSDRIRQTLLWPCGLSDVTAIRGFEAGAGAGSAMTDSGTTHIQVVALDDAMPDFAPTFIKMDIEGAEPAALRGAAGAITRYRPNLAVCVYHHPEHLWELPLLIRELVPDHQVALRAHKWNGFDMVAYAYCR